MPTTARCHVVIPRATARPLLFIVFVVILDGRRRRSFFPLRLTHDIQHPGCRAEQEKHYKQQRKRPEPFVEQPTKTTPHYDAANQFSRDLETACHGIALAAISTIRRRMSGLRGVDLRPNLGSALLERSALFSRHGFGRLAAGRIFIRHGSAPSRQGKAGNGEGHCGTTHRQGGWGCQEIRSLPEAGIGRSNPRRGGVRVLAVGQAVRYVSAMMDPLAPPILIAGPTASGKSALAMRLAELAGGVVINADALQVYRDLSVLTARPSPEDEARVPHRLYGHVPASEAYSVGRYLPDVRDVLAQCDAAGLRPIIVGGTGLYFKALIEGLSPVPVIAADVRSYWRSEAQRLGAAALHAVLAECDPEMAARLRPSDPQRVTRALEVLHATGRSLGHWQRLPGDPVIKGKTIRLVIRPDKVELRARCDARFDQMIAAGSLDEVRRLAALQLDPALPVLGALGVAPLLAHLRGEADLGAAVAQAKLETWHYVKRQFTWLKRNMMSWNEVQKDDLERNDRSIMRIVENASAVL
jgi:tRNA dimethylallyltransferase